MTQSAELPSRIVVRGTNWVGDTVMSIPAIREIRRIFPSSEITLWGPSGLEPLLRATGVPTDVIAFDAKVGGPLVRSVRMSRRLAQRFDLAILLQNAFESALTAWLACVPARAGFPTDLRGPFLSIPVPLIREIRAKHQVFYYLAISAHIRELFRPGEWVSPDVPDCSVEIPDRALDEARSLLRTPGFDPNGPVFCLCPGSVNSEAKRWPRDYFARLGDLLVGRFSGSVAFVGAPSERGLIDGIVSDMRYPGATNLAGKTDMITSMAVMRLSRMVISNDTGSAHLAVAASARVLTVFGPTVVGATAPFGPNAHVIQGQAPCAPCRHFRCPVSGHPCMRGVTPEAVLSRVEEILARERKARDLT